MSLEMVLRLVGFLNQMEQQSIQQFSFFQRSVMSLAQSVSPEEFDQRLAFVQSMWDAIGSDPMLPEPYKIYGASVLSTIKDNADSYKTLIEYNQKLRETQLLDLQQKQTLLEATNTLNNYFANVLGEYFTKNEADALKFQQLSQQDPAEAYKFLTNLIRTKKELQTEDSDAVLDAMNFMYTKSAFEQMLNLGRQHIDFQQRVQRSFTQYNMKLNMMMKGAMLGAPMEEMEGAYRMSGFEGLIGVIQKYATQQVQAKQAMSMTPEIAQQTKSTLSEVESYYEKFASAVSTEFRNIFGAPVKADGAIQFPTEYITLKKTDTGFVPQIRTDKFMKLRNDIMSVYAPIALASDEKLNIEQLNPNDPSSVANFVVNSAFKSPYFSKAELTPEEKAKYYGARWGAYANILFNLTPDKAQKFVKQLSGIGFFAQAEAPAIIASIQRIGDRFTKFSEGEKEEVINFLGRQFFVKLRNMGLISEDNQKEFIESFRKVANAGITYVSKGEVLGKEVPAEFMSFFDGKEGFYKLFPLLAMGTVAGMLTEGAFQDELLDSAVDGMTRYYELERLNMYSLRELLSNEVADPQRLNNVFQMLNGYASNILESLYSKGLDWTGGVLNFLFTSSKITPLAVQEQRRKQKELEEMYYMGIAH